MPIQTLSGTSNNKRIEGEKFNTWTTIFKASPQKDLGNLACESKHITLSTNVLFILSTKPFNCGIFGGVFWWLILCYLRYSSNDLEYSLLLSVKIHLSFLLVYLSIEAWNYLNTPDTLSLWLNVYAQIFFEWSSIKVTKYSEPPRIFTFIWPYKLEWTKSSKFSFLEEEGRVLKATLFCFPTKQWAHFCRHVFVIPDKWFFRNSTIIHFSPMWPSL